jgi:hypothetical protein
LGFIHNSCECFRIPDGEIRQHFAIDCDFAGFHAVDKPAVRCAILSGCCVDAGDPQTTQVAPAGTSITIGIPQAFQHGFVGSPEQSMARAKLAFIQFQYFLMMLATDYASFYSGHYVLSCEPLGAGNISGYPLRAPNSRK